MTSPPTLRLAGVLLVGLASAPGCVGPSGEDEATLDRSVFVATYVDLRVAALESEGALDVDRKRAILSEHGVTEDELVEFAEVHGPDAPFMRDVWNEVGQKLDSVRTAHGLRGGEGDDEGAGEGRADEGGRGAPGGPTDGAGATPGPRGR